MKTKFITFVTAILIGFPVLLFSQKINYETKSYADSNAVKRYTITVKYPQIINYHDNKVQTQINSIIETDINQTAGNFVKDMQEWDLTDIPKDFSSEFDCNFQVYYNQDKIFSFSFEIYHYYAGAAHPYSYSKCMNLDLEHGRIIDFNFMFNDANSGLKKLSDYCFKDLKKQSEKADMCTDDEWLKEGTKPEIENFENTSIEQDGLIVIFNSYQVACYAAGPQQVKIPFSELKKVINPYGPLGLFIK